MDEKQITEDALQKKLAILVDAMEQMGRTLARKIDEHTEAIDGLAAKLVEARRRIEALEAEVEAQKASA
jgi:hypothetical protein